MFEIPLIVEAVDTTDINDMAGGQYADSMSWTDVRVGTEKTESDRA